LKFLATLRPISEIEAAYPVIVDVEHKGAYAYNDSGNINIGVINVPGPYPRKRVIFFDDHGVLCDIRSSGLRETYLDALVEMVVPVDEPPLDIPF
jgi:hypothetical protein